MFHAHLVYLFIAQVAVSLTVNALVIIELFSPLEARLGIFGDGERDVGAQRQKLPVRAAESYHVAPGEKVEILRIERIFFKPAHAVLFITVRGKQRAELHGQSLPVAAAFEKALNPF